MRKRMLISGVSGLMGGGFAAIASRHYVTHGIYSRHPVRIPSVTCIARDLLNDDGLVSLLNCVHPDIIVLFAAATDVDWCETHRPKSYAINVRSVSVMTAWAKLHQSKVIYLSSDSVFDGVRGSYVEEDQVNPVNYYAVTKGMAEQIVRHDVDDHLIIRSNIYGCNIQNKLSFSEWSLRQLNEGVAFNGFSDVIFTPILVNTLSELIIQLISMDVSGTIHIGSRDVISKYDFIKRIAAVFNLESDFLEKESVANVNFIAPRPKSTSLTCSMAIDAGLTMPTVASDLNQLRDLYDSGYPQAIKTWNLPNL